MFPVAREIWKHTKGMSRLKLLAAAASVSRPFLRPFTLGYLKMISRSGTFWAEYNNNGKTVSTSFRLSELPSDFTSFREVGIGDCYHVPKDFQPNVVIDGGGNTGLFTISVLNRWPESKVIVVEPLVENIRQIENHLRMNSLSANVHQCCLGFPEGILKFYRREANQGSFDPSVPYYDSLDIRVMSIHRFLSLDPKERCLIKLDIEGAELSVIEDFLRGPHGNSLIVGELHDVKRQKEKFFKLLAASGWTGVLFDESEHCAIFHATPEAKL